jgi:hypothetical protein
MRAAPARLPRPVSSVLPVLFLGLVLAASPAAAQIGNVLSFVKHGGATAPFNTLLVTGDELGGTAVGLGDLDGAGPSTFAVAVGSALSDDISGVDKGAVYICFLNSSGGILSTTKISPSSGGLTGPIDVADEFGTSVAFLGDLDKSGPSVAAIAVGAPGDDDGAGAAGAVYILFLNSSGSVIAQQKISRLAGGFTATLDATDEMGGSIAWLGDMDGARGSVATIAVGAVGDDDGGLDRGAVHLLFLNANGTVFANRKISALAGGFTGVLNFGSDFGSSVASLQDLDGNGPSVRALAIGAVFDDDGGTDRGAVWITFLSDTGLVISHQKISMTSGNLGLTLDQGDEFGGSVENLGDMDASGAGVTTLAVAATGDDDGGTDRGAVYLLHLTSAGTVSTVSKISNTAGTFSATLANLDGLGSSVTYLGDLDGAGPSGVAIAVGATGDSGGKGAFYILFLSGTPTTDAPRGPFASGLGILGAASPNPFRVTTAIPYQLDADSGVEFEIRDVTGRLVRRYDFSRPGVGRHSLVWDGRDAAGRAVPAGAYFVRMAVPARGITQSGKAVVIR